MSLRRTSRTLAPAGAADTEGELGSGWLAAILDSSPDAIMAWTLDGQLTGWNRGCERILGYPQDQAIGLGVDVLWPAEVRPRLESMVAAARDTAEPSRIETDYRRQDGTTVSVAVTISAIRDAHERITGVSSVVRDISDRKRFERMLAEERTRWRAAFDHAPIGMVLADLDGQWLDVNHALSRLLGRDRGDLVGTDGQSLAVAPDVEGDRDQRAELLRGEIERYETERRYRRPDGELVWTAVSVTLVRDPAGEPLYFVGQFRDVTADEEANSALERYAGQLAQLARRDPLTGLPNYREFRTQVEHEVERSRRYGQGWSVALFDIDGFGRLNEVDRFRADQALALTGEAIVRACRASDRAARIGADEFALILPHTESHDAETTAGRIARAVQEAGVASLSYAVVSWPQDGDSAELLLLRADMRLREAKRGPSGVPATDPCPTDAIRELVSVAQQFLEMDVAYLARIDDTGQSFEALSGDANSFGFAPGDVLELESTYCQRMLDGRIPNVVPVVSDERELRDLAITAQAGIGSYVGVPVRLDNGHTYGTLCGISHAPLPRLEDANLEVLQSFAHLIAGHLEHDALEASARRAGAELTGVNALLSALTARDHYTGEHSASVVELASAVARHLGLTDEQVRAVEQVALLHDIGKVGIPDSILQKRGPLSEAEWKVMRQHPTIGARILAGIPMFAHLAPAVGAEHERFDGTGYPDGLVGDSIPLASRIAFACDAYHAITSDRPYRRALDDGSAREELLQGAGTQFDPAVVHALLAVLDDEPSPHAAPPGEDVLSVTTPRQTPGWTADPDSGAGQMLGHARAACQKCGAHVPIVVTRASVGGRCHNCGSYELVPIIG